VFPNPSVSGLVNGSLPGLLSWIQSRSFVKAEALPEKMEVRKGLRCPFTWERSYTQMISFALPTRGGEKKPINKLIRQSNG
jgi:hypothetical protein